MHIYTLQVSINPTLARQSTHTDVYTQRPTSHFLSNELNHWEFVAKVIVLSSRLLGLFGAWPSSFFWKPVLDQGPVWRVGKKPLH